MLLRHLELSDEEKARLITEGKLAWEVEATKFRALFFNSSGYGGFYPTLVLSSHPAPIAHQAMMFRETWGDLHRQNEYRYGDLPWGFFVLSGKILPRLSPDPSRVLTGEFVVDSSTATFTRPGGDEMGAIIRHDREALMRYWLTCLERGGR